MSGPHADLTPVEDFPRDGTAAEPDVHGSLTKYLVLELPGQGSKAQALPPPPVLDSA